MAILGFAASLPLMQMSIFRRIGALTIAAMLAAVSIPVIYVDLAPLTGTARGGFIMCSVFYVVGFIYLLVMVFIIEEPLRRMLQVRNPQVGCVTYMIDALKIVHSQAMFADQLQRSSLIQKIELTAKCIESGLAKNSASDDLLMDAWTTRRMKEIADGVRELKRWCITPMDTTAADLNGILEENIIAAALGKWSHFATVDRSKMSSRSVLTIFSATKLPAIFVSFIPLFGIACWLWINGGLPESWFNYATAIAVIWMIISLLMLDTSFPSRIASFRSIKEVFSLSQSDESGPRK